MIKPIPDFTGYFADGNGNIYSAIPKGCRNRYDKSKWTSLHLLKQRILKHAPYCRVYMRRDSTGKREDVYVHRIVAQLFVPNPESLSEVNHIDSNPLNNKADNLEWCNHRYNLEYGFLNGNKGRDNLGRFCKRQKV